MFNIPFLIPDLEQIVFDYAMDVEFICQHNAYLNKKIVRNYVDIDHWDWAEISKCGTLSESFIIEFADKLGLYNMLPSIIRINN